MSNAVAVVSFCTNHMKNTCRERQRKASIQYKCMLAHTTFFWQCSMSFHSVTAGCGCIAKAFPERHRGNHGPCDVAACCVRHSRSDAEKLENFKAVFRKKKHERSLQRPEGTVGILYVGFRSAQHPIKTNSSIFAYTKILRAGQTAEQTSNRTRQDKGNSSVSAQPVRFGSDSSFASKNTLYRRSVKNSPPLRRVRQTARHSRGVSGSGTSQLARKHNEAFMLYSNIKY